MVLTLLRRLTGEERSLSLCRNVSSLDDDVSAPVVVPSRRRTWPVRPAMIDHLEDDVIDFHGEGTFRDNYTEVGCVGVGTSATVSKRAHCGGFIGHFYVLSSVMQSSRIAALAPS